MTTPENARAQHEAVQTASLASRSADRARFWAGLNRYLSAEAAHAQKVAHDEKAAERAADEPGDAT